MWNASFKLTLSGCVVFICCVEFAFLDLVGDEPNDSLLISSATVIVCAGGAIWLNPFATVLFSVCNAVTVECYVLYPCCMGVFGMFAVM